MRVLYRTSPDPALNVEPQHLDPAFRRDVEELLMSGPYEWLVTFGFRSRATQAQLYAAYQAGGPKAAPPGRSAHEAGLAVDVVLDGDASRPGVQPTWDLRLAGWVWLIRAVSAHPRLRSGVRYGDAGHIERYKWDVLTQGRIA